ncbi:4'-phosphopantetheinyl transferase [Trichocladium antarcticum]|uniref:holo-[acyl-carrier-protein] synthase n=1 Tax=Trichocladium antarcticum TaxID=1450529 RepID=A0AAN6ZGN0_9PEZI|nr:4'-phosphopantetheinyl transferase [Trichocladium antarcticum]
MSVPHYSNLSPNPTPRPFSALPIHPSILTNPPPSPPAQASRALSLLPPAERAACLRYYHLRDAKMALASALLKHYAVARLAAVPWDATAIGRDARTKPVYVDPATGRAPVAFNVTHQAGVVALVAVAGYRPRRHGHGHGAVGKDAGEEEEEAVQVGVDLVCTSERRDRDQAMLRADGWSAFVDMHGDVFAPREVGYLKHRVLSAVPGLVAAAGSGDGGAVTGEQIADGKLRAFYALWALREAYVKLTGEALLAEWLGELEFREFRPPRPTAGWDVPADEGDEAAQVVRRMDIWFRGVKVEDVNMCLRAMGPDYMIATAVRTPGNKEDGLGWRLGAYEMLSLEEVLDFAEASR